MCASNRREMNKNPMTPCPKNRSIAWMLVCGLAMISVHLAVFPAFCGQTRDVCDKCCKETGLDDYYFEQCKLKCFRNPDHCLDRKSTNVPAVAPQATSPPIAPQRLIPTNQEATPPPPPVVSQPAEPAPTTSKPPKREIAFRWPDSLNIVPGKEWETAGQILMANGIPPQHPNSQLALKAVEGVLVDFARRNPTGGELPTDQLEKILRQYR